MLCHQGCEQRGEYSVGSVPAMKISLRISSRGRLQLSVTRRPVSVSIMIPSTRPGGLGKSLTGVFLSASFMSSQIVAAFMNQHNPADRAFGRILSEPDPCHQIWCIAHKPCVLVVGMGTRLSRRGAPDLRILARASFDDSPEHVCHDIAGLLAEHHLVARSLLIEDFSVGIGDPPDGERFSLMPWLAKTP